jgi:hypothetical protein
LIKQGVIKRKLAAGLPPIQTQTTPEPIEARRAEGQALPKSFRREPDLITGGALASGVPPVQRKQQSFQESIEDDIARKFGLTAKVKKVQEGLGTATDIMSDPLRFISGNLGEIFALATPMAVAAVAVSLVEEGVDAFESLFDDGGPLDTRKLIHNASKVVPQLQSLEDMSSGTVFFTADAGQKLRQVAPTTSNTRQLQQEHMRYIVQFQGT